MPDHAFAVGDVLFNEATGAPIVVPVSCEADLGQFCLCAACVIHRDYMLNDGVAP